MGMTSGNLTVLCHVDVLSAKGELRLQTARPACLQTSVEVCRGAYGILQVNIFTFYGELWPGSK